jgi:hypothetical protein
MTFVLAWGSPTFGGIAADTSCYNRVTGHHGTADQKIIRTAGGWISGAGYGVVLQQVYRKLLASDTPLAHVDVGAIVRDVNAGISSEHRARYERSHGTIVANNHIITAYRVPGGFMAGDFYFDGKGSVANVPMALACPVGDAQARLEELAAEAPTWTDPRMALRRLAAMILECHGLGDGKQVSDRIHVGYTTRDGRDYFLPPTPCADVLAATDADLDARVGPALGPGDQNALYDVVRGSRIVNGRRVTINCVCNEAVIRSVKASQDPTVTVSAHALYALRKLYVVYMGGKGTQSVRIARSNTAYPAAGQGTVTDGFNGTVDTGAISYNVDTFVTVTPYPQLGGQGFPGTAVQFTANYGIVAPQLINTGDGLIVQSNSCRLSRSGSLTVTTSTTTPVDWNTEESDVGGLHDNVTNPERITVPTGGNRGIWLLTATIDWAANATGYRSMSIVKNGTTTLAQNSVANIGGTVGPIHGAVAIDPAPSVGDWYRVAVFQDSGGNLNANANGLSVFTGQHLPY